MQASDTHPPGPTVGDRYRVVLEVARRLTGTRGTDELYEAVYSETSKLLEAVGFYISLYDADRDLARIVFFADRDEVRLGVDITYPGSRSEVIRSGKGVLVSERLEERSLTLLGDDDSKITVSGVSAPIIHMNRIVGNISAQSYQPHAYDSEDLAMLQCIADLAGVALENARQMASLEARRREAEQIEEIGRALVSSLDTSDVLGKVVEAVTSILSVDGAAVWLLDDAFQARVAASGGDIVIPVGAKWDLSGEIADGIIVRQEPVVVDDLENSALVPSDLRDYLGGGSGMGVPLYVEGRVAGILSAGSRQDRHFSTEDVGILRRLASQASVALENARLHSNVQALSLTDPLTGLPNRRRLQIHLDKEVAAARRGRRLIVVVFDLNDFKRYNDTLGHMAGDDILRAFSGILDHENRAMNLVARYGGDEFVSVLSETDPNGAHGYVERVIGRLESDPVLAPHAVSVSVGMVEFDKELMSTGDDVLHAADADMYRAKRKRIDAQRPPTSPEEGP